MKVRPRRAWTAGLIVGAAALLSPPAASAAITIGSDLSAPANSTMIGADATLATETAPGRIFRAPSDGVVVRWRVVESNGLLAFRVLRPDPAFPGNRATGISTSTTQNTGPGVQGPFPTRQPIRTGDRIALDGRAATRVGNRPGGTFDAWFDPTPLLDGETRSANLNDQGLEVVYSADIEPDADGDGFGDETQDQCPTNPSTQGACPPAATPPAANPGPTGQRSRARRTCRRKYRRDVRRVGRRAAKRKLRACLRRANRRPV